MGEERNNWIDETTLRQGEGIYLSRQMRHSKAFIKLTGAAKQILLESYMRLKLNSTGRKHPKQGQRFFAENNGKLVISYPSIHKQFGYSLRTISKAINQLTSKGFWSIAELGCGVKRQSHKIALIKNWQDYGKENFKPGEGKSEAGPVNDGFKKRRKLETTLQSKEGTTLQSKAVQAQNEDKPP